MTTNHTPHTTTGKISTNSSNLGVDLEFDKQHIWHPYTSMNAPLPVYPVKSAEGCLISLETGETLIDGMSSWWSVIHGYNHPAINDAVQSQLQQMSHVMFGGLTHQPAVELVKLLVEMSPAGLEKVFLADSGSVSVEVALKMAIQYQLGQGHRGRNKFISLTHAYHGDTFGAMSVCDPVNSMHSLYAGMLPENIFISSPKSKPDEEFNPKDLEELAEVLTCRGDTVAALIIEPIVQGAGGMRFYHPDFLSGAKRLCEEAGVLLIADEIATGFGRTGKLFACEHADISPDIMCVGKGLTGGYMTLAATLCSSEVANGISASAANVLMHGPTFMGNPLACSAAIASLKILQQGDWKEQVITIEKHLQQALKPAQDWLRVANVRVFGAIGVIELKENIDVATIQKRFVDNGVWIRPFGKLVYIMPPYIISTAELQTLTERLLSVLAEALTE